MPLKAVALVGATGTGKSALALQLAAGSSIVSCDSMQVYRHLDIGTAKPTAGEMARVPHYLIDIMELPAICSAARWADEAAAVIARENEAGKVPLIVGGTGMYLRALVEGFADIPEEGEGVRARFELIRKEHGTPYLHELLGEVDPVMSDRLEQGDTQRIMRALCVFESSGVPLSQWQQQAANAPKIDCPTFVLNVPRELLRERIAGRFHQMMDEGWLDETRWLLEQKLEDTHPAMRAVGYRQLIGYLQGECSLEEAVQDGITATRRFAKRQNTWFRNQTSDAITGSAEVLAPLMSERLQLMGSQLQHG